MSVIEAHEQLKADDPVLIAFTVPIPLKVDRVGVAHASPIGLADELPQLTPCSTLEVERDRLPKRHGPILTERPV